MMDRIRRVVLVVTIVPTVVAVRIARLAMVLFYHEIFLWQVEGRSGGEEVEYFGSVGRCR